jgi:hypothetical protein
MLRTGILDILWLRGYARAARAKIADKKRAALDCRSAKRALILFPSEAIF